MHVVRLVAFFFPGGRRGPFLASRIKSDRPVVSGVAAAEGVVMQTMTEGTAQCSRVFRPEHGRPSGRVGDHDIPPCRPERRTKNEGRLWDCRASAEAPSAGARGLAGRHLASWAARPDAFSASPRPLEAIPCSGNTPWFQTVPLPLGWRHVNQPWPLTFVKCSVCCPCEQRKPEFPISCEKDVLQERFRRRRPASSA